MDWLDRNKIKYQVLDVTSDRSAWDEMFRLTNQSFAPVIEVDGEVLADFGATELAQFWNSLDSIDVGNSSLQKRKTDSRVAPVETSPQQCLYPDAWTA